MNNLIAVLEDEVDIADLVSIHLKKSGFRVEAFENVKSFFKAIAKKRPDLVILDIMLPDMDGYEVCKELKKNDAYSDIPIIMLTAKGEEIDKILGLELGADDYVTKPFSPKELVSRVKAVLRRGVVKQSSRKIAIENKVEIDTEQEDNNDDYGLGHRWLGIAQTLGTPTSYGWVVGTAAGRLSNR